MKIKLHWLSGVCLADAKGTANSLHLGYAVFQAAELRRSELVREGDSGEARGGGGLRQGMPTEVSGAADWGVEEEERWSYGVRYVEDGCPHPPGSYAVGLGEGNGKGGRTLRV